MTNRGLKVFIVVGSLFLLAAGVWLLLSGAPGAVSDLTPIPELEVTSTDPEVQEQFRTARAALERNPTDSNLNGRLGVLCELYQYPESARVCYERASALSPGDFRWKYYHARIEHLLGNPSATVSILKSAMVINDRYTPAIALLGNAYLELGRVDDAEQTFRAALAGSPRSCSALLGLGQTLANQGDHKSAIQQFERGLLVAPKHAPLHYAIGLSYRAVGQSDRAEEHLKISQEGASANPDGDPLLVEIYEQEVGVDSDYRKAVRRLNARQYDESIVMLRKVLSEAPDHFGARGALANALSRTEKSTEAIVEYEKAIALNPTNIDFLRPYALLLHRAERFEEAEASLQKVITLGGDHEDDHHVLGATLLQLGRPEEAARQFELALERKPDYEGAHRALIHALRTQASMAATDADALPFIRRVTELEPLDLQGWTILGGTLERLGDLPGALEAFDKALAIAPDLPLVLRRREEVKKRIEGGG